MKRVFALAAAAILSACSTRKDLDTLPSDAGIPKTYAAPVEKVRLAAQDSLAELAFKPVDKYTRSLTEARWRIIAGQGVSAGSTGRYARVDVEDQKTQCTVWIVVRSKMDSREAMGTDNVLAEDLHKKIAARLAR
jgi:hypothetical protein